MMRGSCQAPLSSLEPKLRRGSGAQTRQAIERKTGDGNVGGGRRKAALFSLRHRTLPHAAKTCLRRFGFVLAGRFPTYTVRETFSASSMTTGLCWEAPSSFDCRGMWRRIAGC